ncbi:MAG: TetR/AcrR family transcriptional regulator [Deltaproteobacteria bacterium]|nr:MAG: TetR/AcrR family transcriptional regulator [Deltaproteobacteria bacterium]
MAARASVRSLAWPPKRKEPRLGAQAERTRAAILQAAEASFSERGFAATRLEDVAAQVGIRRASIVYYFPDKRALYDAVLADVFGDLLDHFRDVLVGDEPLPRRIETAVGMFVDHVAKRPSLPRLLLRQVTDPSAEELQVLVQEHTTPFIAFVGEMVRGRRARDEARLSSIDPAHLACAIAGATLFFAAALPAFVPGSGAGEMQPEALAAHRQQVLEITRRLLHLAPDPASYATSPERASGDGSPPR